MYGLKRLSICVGAVLALTSASAAGQTTYLMITGTQPSPTTRGVMLFDPLDGAQITPSGTWYFQVTESTALLKHPLQVGDEIWITAQSGSTGNRILRYTLEGDFLGDITAAGPEGELMGNVRGMELIGDVVYVTNAAGDFSDSVIRFDTSGNWLETHQIGGSPFSLLDYQGDLLVGHSLGFHRIDRFDHDVNFIEVFHDGALNFPQQMVERSNGNVLVAGFSPPAGVYEYDSLGNQVDYIAGSGPRGVWELGNGNILFTNSGGVHVYDINTQETTHITSSFNAHFVGLLTVGDPAPACPGDLTDDGNVGVADLLELLAAWGPVDPGHPADLTGDGNVGVADLLELLANWGPCP